MTPEPFSPFAPGTLKVVSFMAGHHRYAVEATQVRTQSSDGAVRPLPIPVEQLLGLPDSGTQNPVHRRILLMKHPASDYAVAVCAPVEFYSLKITAIHPLPPLIAARCKLAGLRGLAMGKEGVTLLVDLRSLQNPDCPGFPAQSKSEP